MTKAQLIAELDRLEAAGGDRAPDALAESDARFRTLIDGSNQGVLVHRLMRPLYANRALAEMFGYADADDILALDSSTALWPEFAEESTRQHQARLRGDAAPVDFEFRGRRADGPPFG
jgi:PAS domain S-box-containing protein